MTSTRAPGRARRFRDERGQGLVEFALILPIFVLLLGGIIQFGFALNFWLDLQRVANQGARQAAVNNWPPNCPQGSGANTCSNWPATCSANQTGATLQETVYCQLLLQSEAVPPGCTSSAGCAVKICYPAATQSYSGKHAGDPVRVSISRPFKIVGIPFFSGLSAATIRASATMRLEQSQDPLDPGAVPHLSGEVSC
jgi:hypothetical protein